MPSQNRNNDSNDSNDRRVNHRNDDEYYDEPYFYVSLHPAPHATMLPGLPEVGHWHTDDFTAAITTASKILAAKNQAAGLMSSRQP